MTIIRAAVICILLSGCATQSAVAPVAAPKETPINSLALEQCIRESGPDGCLTDLE
ncbi:hypothetical protein [Rhizobium sp.]